MEPGVVRGLMKNYFKQVEQDVQAFERAVDIKMHATTVEDEQYIIGLSIITMLNQDYLKVLEFYHLKMEELENHNIEHALTALFDLLEAAKRVVTDKDSLKQSGYEERKASFREELSKTGLVNEN